MKKEELSKKRWKQTVKNERETFKEEFLAYLQSRKYLFLIKFSDDIELIFDDEAREPLLIIRVKNNEILPSLQTLRKCPDILPKIWTDTGATKFLLNGANLFRPGITKFDIFQKNQVVQVVNPMGNVLSIGEVIYSSIKMPDRGEVLKTISYLNDEIWSIADQIK